MVSIKRYGLLNTALAVVGFYAANMASALSLGDIALHSRLHQPLHGEIALTDIGDFNSSEIFSNLASEADFQRAGIQRPYNLLDLRFKTQVRPDGTGSIKVTSTHPIQEPFVNFLLEVHWPNGRLLREYTLLMDPPGLDDPVPEPITPPTTIPRRYALPEIRGRLAPVSRPDAVDPSAPQYPVIDSGNQSNETYKVRRNDNLWYIADDLRPDSGVSVEQTMMALLRLNPDAFVGHNINRLKKGVVLRVPDGDTVRTLTHEQAAWQVAMHHKAWKQNTRLPQLDASYPEYREPSGFTQAPSPSGRLSIVSPNETSRQGKTDNRSNDEQATRLQNELLMTREHVDKLSRENSELKSRLQDLDDQIATLNKLVMLKDDQLAALQTEQEEPEPESTAQKTAEAPSEETQAEGSRSGSETPPLWDSLSIPEIALPMPKVNLSLESLNNPVLLGLIGLLPLLVAAGFIIRRRRGEGDFDEEDLLDDLDFATSADEQGAEENTQLTDDPINDADGLMAHGNFEEAINTLKSAISDTPDNASLHVKLLEAYAESGHLEGFKAALAELEQLGQADALKSAEVLKTRFGDDAFVEPSETISETPEPDEFPSLDEMDLDLDAMDDDVKTLADAPSESDEDSESFPDLSDTLAFESPLEDPAVEEAVSEEAQTDDDDNGLAFDTSDLDFSVPEPEPESEPDAATTDDGAPGLDFDVSDLGLEDKPNTPEEPVSVTPDEGLTLDIGDSAEVADAVPDGVDETVDEAFDEDMNFLSDDDDEIGIKLDLARAYMDMGDNDGASDILDEVVEQGNEQQQAEARELMEQL
ncbi:FimV/HubP family polar landmark protein [Candidatus Sororendozoicomonas aggregata]|uniref:FimV/HubP family polar landmark protein n=1 Tax=Candidatus Sororendozoicomonas aggregata TaxID=3073239 RepID=UPI002ED3CD2B